MAGFQNYWDRVNSLIKSKGTTQRELSKLCGFTERRIESLSTGIRSPDIEESVKIAHALGTTVEFLVTGKNSESINLNQIQESISHVKSSLQFLNDNITALCNITGLK